MEKTNSGLVEYAKAQVGLPYWYGTYGQTADENLYSSKSKQYPKYYTASDFQTQYGSRVHDCVGLIKGYLWSNTPTSKPSYNASQDKSAKGMYAFSTDRGSSITCKLKKGILLYKGSSPSSIHHVGIYDGSGNVIEAKGHAYGVVVSKYKKSDWPYWSQCPFTTSDEECVVVAKPTLKEGDVGESVTVLQSNLNAFGYKLLEDGKFGSKTKTALIDWQTQNKVGTIYDGIYGKKSYAKMKELL